MFKWTFLERENIVESRTVLHLSLRGLDSEILAIKVPVKQIERHSPVRRVIVLRCAVTRHLSDIDSALGHFLLKNLIGLLRQIQYKRCKGG